MRKDSTLLAELNQSRIILISISITLGFWVATLGVNFTWSTDDYIRLAALTSQEGFELKDVKIINITTANEMYMAVKKYLKSNIAIFTAAVSDIKPKKIIKHKIKKEKFKKISLINNADIVKKICSSKKLRPQLVIGFAAETENLISNATKKIKDKGCDWIVGNEVNKNNKVFGSDFNKIILKYSLGDIIMLRIIRNGNARYVAYEIS